MLALFFVFPIVTMYHRSFPAGIGWDRIFEILTSRMLTHAIEFSIFQAGLSTLLTLAVALPMVIVFLLYDFPGKRRLQLMVSLPFVLPTVVVAAAFRAVWNSGRIFMEFFGFSGVLPETGYGLSAVLTAHIFYNASVVFRIVGGYGSGLDPSLVHSARILGASVGVVVFRILLPILKPAIAAASLLVFLFCFSSFGVILLLGGPEFSTLEIEIYRQAVHFFNLPRAAILSLVQIVFTAAVLAAYLRLQKPFPAVSTGFPDNGVLGGPRTRTEKGTTLLVRSFCLVFFGCPLLILMLQSVWTDDGFSLVYFGELLRNPTDSVFYIPPIQAVAHSLGFSAVAMFISLFIGVPVAAYLSVAQGRIKFLADVLFMLPLSTSAVTLGFGFLLAFDQPPLNLRGSWILIPISHALVAFPLVVRTLIPAFQGIPAHLGEAASLLGASVRQVWQYVTLSLVRRSLSAVMIFSVMISLGEFGATALIARPQTATVPLAIYRFLGQPGSLNYGQAMAMSTLLLLITAAGFQAVECLTKNRRPEFRS
jgi:thiamine transport system permease protein